MTKKEIHVPVLLNEVVLGFAPALSNGGVFVDATLGAGGHTYKILDTYPKVTAVGIDRDEEVLQHAQKALSMFEKRVSYIQGNFRTIRQLLKENNKESIQAIFADIGVSSYQLDNDSRGFSFRKEAPLDMRMDQSQDVTAELIIKTWNEKKIADMLFQYAEERFAFKIAKAIVTNRQAINSTTDLAAVIEKVIPPRYRKGKIHPATKTFQALRIAVNDEIGALKEFLSDAPDLLSKNSILGVISFHSLEDRLVRQKFATLAAQGGYKLLTKHPIIANDDEISLNRRSRSAKLRFIQRTT